MSIMHAADDSQLSHSNGYAGADSIQHKHHIKETQEEKMDRVLSELAEIRKTMDDTRTVVEKVFSEIKPILDKMMTHSMFKMFFGGK